jgi:hypothetical protein
MPVQAMKLAQQIRVLEQALAELNNAHNIFRN